MSRLQPGNSVGPTNSICDVEGIRVGHAQDLDLVTGTTVVLPEKPCVAAVDHRGGGIGARDTVLLNAGSGVPHVHAITLSGGSAYGLDASGGVMQGLRQDGIGMTLKDAVVPIVPAAIIFDLLIGKVMGWDHPPWWDLGLEAYHAAKPETGLGNVGAGTGATAGSIKGGLGTASAVTSDYTVGALSVANPVGEVLIPDTRTFWGWMFERDGELGGQTPPTNPIHPTPIPDSQPGANTTLAVVATDADLTRDQAYRVAIMAQDGFAQTIRPVHSPMDGDTVFVLSTGVKPFAESPMAMTELGTLAAECVARAVMRGVHAAGPLGGYASYQSLAGGD